MIECSVGMKADNSGFFLENLNDFLLTNTKLITLLIH